MTTPSPPPAIPWQVEVHVAIRDGLACRACGLAIVADEDRQVVRVDPAAGDEADNLALLCQRCAADHRVHPQPLDPAHEKFERLG